MLFVNGFAGVYNLEGKSKNFFKATLRSSEKVQGGKDDEYKVTFLDAIFVGNANTYGREILEEKDFIKILSSKLEQTTWEDKKGNKRYGYQLVVFEFSKQEPKAKEIKKSWK